MVYLCLDLGVYLLEGSAVTNDFARYTTTVLNGSPVTVKVWNTF